MDSWTDGQGHAVKRPFFFQNGRIKREWQVLAGHGIPPQATLTKTYSAKHAIRSYQTRVTNEVAARKQRINPLKYKAVHFEYCIKI